MALSEIVSVAIQAGTVNPARRGFGIPLILAYHTVWSDTQVRRYTSMAGVAADFASSSMPYKAASAFFDQNPRPEAIKIGRLPSPGTGHIQAVDFTDHPTGSAITGSVVSPDGTTTAINVAWNTNIATTLAALDTALELISGLTVAVTSPTITITGGAPFGRMWHLSFPTGYVKDTTADWAYDIALANHADVDGDFFAVVVDNNSPKNMDKVARWCLSNQRICLFAPVYGKPSQFVSGEFTSGADYTALLANNNAIGLFTETARSEFKEARWAGKMLPLDPGSATWAFKTLSGAGADAWSDTERSTIDTTNKGNHFTREAGVNITRPGKCFGGEWIDVTIGLEWLKAQLEEEMFSLLINNPKIPYTDVGIGQIVAVVRGVLKVAEDRSVIDSGWQVTAKPAAEQTSADRLARTVRDVEFTARLAGAVHKIMISGTVTA